MSERQSSSSVQEIENVSNVIATAPMKEQGDCFYTCVPVSVKRSDADKDADENVDADHVRTRRLVYEQQPGLFTLCEEIGIDFRLSGLSVAVVKQAQNFSCSRTREEDRESPASTSMGNVDLFELFETIPKVLCSECFLTWNQGIVYCTCGHLLKESEASQHFHRWRVDAFSIENYVIKKERPRGARHGKTEAQMEHFRAHNARRRCLKKKFEGIHNRFLQDSTYRDSLLKLVGLKKRALRWTN